MKRNSLTPSEELTVRECLVKSQGLAGRQQAANFSPNEIVI